MAPDQIVKRSIFAVRLKRFDSLDSCWALTNKRLKVSNNRFFTFWKYRSFTPISADDMSMLFRSRLLRCWSTAGQSPFTDNARTRFKISHRRIDGGVLLSKSTLEPLRDCNCATTASDPGLGGRSEGRRLEGFDPGPPLGIMKVMRKLNQFFATEIFVQAFFLKHHISSRSLELLFFTLLFQCLIISPRHSVIPKVDS